MARYLITYDLRNERDYDELYDAIKTYEQWVHILESVWAVKSEDSAAEIKENLSQHADGDNGLLIANWPSGASWTNINCTLEELAELL